MFGILLVFKWVFVKIDVPFCKYLLFKENWYLRKMLSQKRRKSLLRDAVYMFHYFRFFGVILNFQCAYLMEKYLHNTHVLRKQLRRNCSRNNGVITVITFTAILDEVPFSFMKRSFFMNKWKYQNHRTIFQYSQSLLLTSKLKVLAFLSFCGQLRTL